jgi:hypothetical protein
MKLVAELRGRQPNSSQRKRARDLQRRRKALSQAADAALTKELAVWMALKERLDREPREATKLHPRMSAERPKSCPRFG